MHQCSKGNMPDAMDLNHTENSLIIKNIKKKNQTKALKDIIKPFVESQNLSNMNYNFRQRKIKTKPDNENNNDEDESERGSNDKSNSEDDENGGIYLNKKTLRKNGKRGKKLKSQSKISKISIYLVL